MLGAALGLAPFARSAGGVGAAEVGAAACLGIGARCGRRRQPNCGDCCTGHQTRQRNGQRRCSCRPDGQRCRRADECCGGACCPDGAGSRICLSGLFLDCGGRCPILGPAGSVSCSD